MTIAIPAKVADVLRTMHDLSEVARERWIASDDYAHENKGGDKFDPVTALDLDIERSMRALILRAYPGDGVWGEEEGWSNEGASRIWSLDPIDGTRALICGLPSWAVLVGVIDDGRHIAGMIDLPALNECLISDGRITTRNGEETRSSGCAHLKSARLSTTDPELFEGEERRAFNRVRDAVTVTRYGLDALGYARVATGDIDLVIENKLARHDLDALVAVVRGSGGHIGDWAGGEAWEGGCLVAAASKALYDEAVALLAE